MTSSRKKTLSQHLPEKTAALKARDILIVNVSYKIVDGTPTVARPQGINADKTAVPLDSEAATCIAELLVPRLVEWLNAFAKLGDGSGLLIWTLDNDALVHQHDLTAFIAG